MNLFEDADYLYDAGTKAMNGSKWKYSTQLFEINHLLETAVLQKKVDTAWVRVTSSTGSKEACAAAVAIKGMTYRSFVTSKLYDNAGKYVDSISATSASKTY